MNTTQTKQRRRLFRRLEDNLPPLVLTERDLSILRFVQEYRFLNTAQIQALVGGSYHNVTERLSRLFHLAYLDRPAHQRELRHEGYRVMIYAIAPKGVRAIAMQAGAPASVPRHLGEDNRTAKRFHLAHTLMVSQFRVCLTLACERRPDLTLTRWRIPEQPLARVTVGNRRVAVIPDAYFVITGAEGESAHFFLEADRGTMTQARFLTKLQAYWQLRSRDVSPVSPVIPRAFRVLTIAESRQRMKNLLSTAENADPQHRGSRMFCFAAEGEYGLRHPETLLAPIWRTPAESTPRSLLEGRGGSRD
jgi:hypothetical protein